MKKKKMQKKLLDLKKNEQEIKEEKRLMNLKT